jgi:hypothetical protein
VSSGQQIFEVCYEHPGAVFDQSEPTGIESANCISELLTTHFSGNVAGVDGKSKGGKEDQKSLPSHDRRPYRVEEWKNPSEKKVKGVPSVPSK